MLKTVDVTERFAEFLSEFYQDDLARAMTEGKESVVIDFSMLDRFDIELADHLLEQPEEALAAAEEAVKSIDIGLGEPTLHVRFFNLPETRNIRIRNLRSEHISKLIVVDGIVVRASEIRPEVSEAVFECMQCGATNTVIQTQRSFQKPNRCAECGKRGSLKLVTQTLYDARWVAVEEPFEIVEGERPSQLLIYLKEDLNNIRMRKKTDPGSRINITGVLKEIVRKVRGSRSRQLDIYLDANYVESVEAEWEELEITEKDEKHIIELAKDPKIYDKLVASIAPALYGLEDIKEAIVLQLFGGELKILRDRSRVRGDIHILLVGDPSTAKSVLMKVVSSLIPRGRYVSGKGVTGPGLTATVVRDEEFGWVLEAGALVLTNRSLLAIDEFEKVNPSDQVALMEGMEQQTISIAKASIVATLPAQTAILAGGNPKLGRFDPYLPIREQISVPDVLLSRFDLKFALRDIPNREIDMKVAEHILKSRHFEEETVEPVIDASTLKRYVGYARKRCHPKLTREAGEEIKNFFVEMRERVTEEGAPIPITLRQYEGMIRLAESSAKVRLSDEVTIEDAMRAINLMKVSLREFGLDLETGKFDIDRAEGQKTTAAQRSKIRTMLDVLDQIEAEQGKEMAREAIVERARAEGLDDADQILNKMLHEGMIFAPSPGKIRKT